MADIMWFRIIVLTCTCIVHVDALSSPVDDCPAPSPCTCSGFNIDCSNLSLSEVPPFHKPSEKTKHYTWQIYLSYNLLKTIPGRAFENLTVYWLHLQHNALDTLHEDALWGSENSLQTVFLQYNNFTELPAALTTLRQLNMLSISHNPITTLNENTLRSISGKLQWFDIGSKEMITWPSALKVLTSLFSLTVYSTPIPIFPDDAFQGLENTLDMLDFEDTKIREVPRGLKTLKALSSLMFNDNIDLSDDGFLNDSFSGLTKLSDIYINNSTLTYVPNFVDLENLRYLSISSANITKWDRQNLPQDPLLSSITFDSTLFAKVPEVVSSLPNLASFSMINSKVRNITGRDFEGLSKLQHLTLSRSPIMDISDDAFKDSKLMKELDLSYTNITLFPKAVKSLTVIQDVNLLSDNISCTCASMDWIRNWNHSTFWVDGGVCSNLDGKSINDYIKYVLPACPLQN